MDLTHRFTLPARLDDAWRAFNDLEGLAPCFPGATLSRVEGDEFAGSVKVKLGPIALLYTGSGHYLERDDTARRVVIEARGKDKRGNGTANAKVTASFLENGEQTDVEVVTDLAITGKPAQFGRGVISDVSDRLLAQFVSCVSERFAGQAEPTAGEQPGAAQPEAQAAAEAQATAEPRPAATAPPEPVAPAPAERVAPSAAEPVTPPAPEPAPAASRTGAADQPAATQEELNLLGTVGPVLLKRYGPPIAALAVLLFVVIKIIRRRRS